MGGSRYTTLFWLFLHSTLAIKRATVNIIRSINSKLTVYLFLKLFVFKTTTYGT